MKIVYDESYGDLSFAQRAAYRKYNVSPADHEDIVSYIPEHLHGDITRYVKFNASNNGGMFNAYSLGRDMQFGIG